MDIGGLTTAELPMLTVSMSLVPECRTPRLYDCEMCRTVCIARRQLCHVCARPGDMLRFTAPSTRRARAQFLRLGSAPAVRASRTHPVRPGARTAHNGFFPSFPFARGEIQKKAPDSGARYGSTPN
ncbi:hypothetical protein EVAR_56281_1 [Eumeta japonica]|uniref:Uncharacterized protein n=1 Tax=Eumeta variegata TaxID=151549 RepID=A0A4C1YIT5_EUMVA|nr:hypothetical protein EVAR_56281_1 [Eumeta japonica]